VITLDTQLGGAIYPFLEATGRAWSLVTSSTADPAHYPNPATFGMDKPSLRWVNGDQVKDIFVDGMTTQEFLRATGLQIDMSKKGGFVVSKRLSRLMRPYFASASFPDSAVSITYLDELDADGAKVWDGAGLISREMLRRVLIPDGVSEAKREELLREIARCKRVEFTLMSANGQDKGHAIVADCLPTDFVLPRDTKGEVKLVNGQKFVGINFVHHHEDMRLDIQSLINLGEFYGEDQLANWLEDDGAVFTEAVRTGEVAEAMSRLEHHVSLDEVQQWPLREYFVSGGHPLWFSDVAKNLMNQHLARLNASTLSDMRLPVPGGRFYVMPIGVGQRAGVDHDVPHGHIRIDRDYSTAWVNDEDWVALQDAGVDPKTGKPLGLAGILGGADNDDALWLHGFTDYDGEPKVLCWRSPNQTGEYVILKPTIGSYNLDWKTTEGAVQYPPGDSRLLPPRKDRVRKEYLGLVTEQPPVTAADYTVESMEPTIKQSIANAGTLGMYCNILMVHQAMNGKLPDRLPDELEEVIDASVKTGADLSAVHEWCFAESQKILASDQPLSPVIANRVIGSKDKPVALTHDHRLDRISQRVRTHIAEFEKAREKLMQEAMPPAAIFDHAMNESEQEMVEVGAGLHYVYNNALRLLSKQKGHLEPDDYDQARLKAEAYLNRYPPEQHGAILRGAIVAAYLSEKRKDSMLWLRGAKTDNGYAPGMAQRTMQALRDIGVLQEVDLTSIGVIAYPGASISQPQYQKTIGISSVWFREAQNWQRANGLPVASEPSQISPEARKQAKDKVAEFAKTIYRNLRLTVKAEGERKIAYAQDGQIFGFIAKDSTVDVPEGEITVAFSLSKDGNLRCVWHQTEQDLYSGEE